MKFKIFYILFLIAILGCSDEIVRPDCSLVLCATNDSIQLEIFQNGTNIFASGEITTEDVVVTSSIPEDLRYDVFSNTQGSAEALLTVLQFGQRAATYTYTIVIQASIAFEIMVDYELSGEDPCCGQRLLIRELTSQDVSVTELPGHYRIEIE